MIRRAGNRNTFRARLARAALKGATVLAEKGSIGDSISAGKKHEQALCIALIRSARKLKMYSMGDQGESPTEQGL